MITPSFSPVPDLKLLSALSEWALGIFKPGSSGHVSQAGE